MYNNISAHKKTAKAEKTKKPQKKSENIQPVNEQFGTQQYLEDLIKLVGNNSLAGQSITQALAQQIKLTGNVELQNGMSVTDIIGNQHLPEDCVSIIDALNKLYKKLHQN